MQFCKTGVTKNTGRKDNTSRGSNRHHRNFYETDKYYQRHRMHEERERKDRQYHRPRNQHDRYRKHRMDRYTRIPGETMPLQTSSAGWQTSTSIDARRTPSVIYTRENKSASVDADTTEIVRVASSPSTAASSQTRNGQTEATVIHARLAQNVRGRTASPANPPADPHPLTMPRHAAKRPLHDVNHPTQRISCHHPCLMAPNHSSAVSRPQAPCQTVTPVRRAHRPRSNRALH